MSVQASCHKLGFLVWLVAVATAGVGVPTAAAATPEGKSFQLQVGFGGLGFVGNNAWSAVNLTAENHVDQDQEVLALAALDQDSQLQFGRRLWMPAHSRRTLQIPVRPLGPVSGQSVNLSAYLIDATGAAERQLQKQVGVIRVETDPQVTVMVRGGDEDEGTDDLLTAMRTQVGLSRRLASVRLDQLPQRSEVWDGARTAALAAAGGTSPSDVVAIDPVRLRALGDWVRAGGRLWIALDQVEVDALQDVLDELVQVTVIDRVWVNQLRIAHLGERGPPAVMFQGELPVALARVIAPGMRPVCVAASFGSAGDLEDARGSGDSAGSGGWPVVLRGEVGLGEVWICTVDARALLAAVPAAPLVAGTQRNEETLIQALGQAFLRPPATEPTGAEVGVTLAPQVLPELLRSRVGQRIVSRGMVGGLLLAMLVGLAVGAGWLYRVGRAEWVGGWVVVLALVTAGVMVILGMQRHRATPTTLGEARLMHVFAGQRAAVVTAAAAIYSPAAQRAPLGGSALPTAWPQQTPPPGSLQRLRFHDLRGWEWAQMPLAEGAIKTFSQRGVVELPEPAGVTLGFDERGAAGRITGGTLAASLGDLVLRTATGDYLAVRPDAQGRFTAAAADVLAAGQFTPDLALTDEQQQRQRVMRALQWPRQRMVSSYPDPAAAGAPAPVMLGWTAAAQPAGLQLNVPAKRSDQTLVTLPVTLAPVAEGTRVLVPAPLVTWAATRGKGGGVSVLYDQLNGKWLPSSAPSLVLLHFTPPANVIPLNIHAAVFEVSVDGPGWQVTALVESTSGGKAGLKEIAAIVTDGQLQRIAIPADHLPASPSGQVTLAIRAQPLTPEAQAQSQTAQTMWQIQHVGMELRGVVAQPDPNPARKQAGADRS